MCGWIRLGYNRPVENVIPPAPKGVDVRWWRWYKWWFGLGFGVITGYGAAWRRSRCARVINSGTLWCRSMSLTVGGVTVWAVPLWALIGTGWLAGTGIVVEWIGLGGEVASRPEPDIDSAAFQMSDWVGRIAADWFGRIIENWFGIPKTAWLVEDWIEGGAGEAGAARITGRVIAESKNEPADRSEGGKWLFELVSWGRRGIVNGGGEVTSGPRSSTLRIGRLGIGLSRIRLACLTLRLAWVDSIVWTGSTTSSDATSTRFSTGSSGDKGRCEGEPEKTVVENLKTDCKSQID